MKNTIFSNTFHFSAWKLKYHDYAQNTKIHKHSYIEISLKHLEIHQITCVIFVPKSGHIIIYYQFFGFLSRRCISSQDPYDPSLGYVAQ